MGVTTSTPSREDNPDPTQYKPLVSGDGFISLGNDLPAVTATAGGVEETFESDGWRIHVDDSNGLVSVNGNQVTIDRSGNTRVYLTPCPTRKLIQPAIPSGPANTQKLLTLAHQSCDASMLTNSASNLALFQHSCSGSIVIPAANTSTFFGGFDFSRRSNPFIEFFLVSSDGTTLFAVVDRVGPDGVFQTDQPGTEIRVSRSGNTSNSTTIATNHPEDFVLEYEVTEDSLTRSRLVVGGVLIGTFSNRESFGFAISLRVDNTQQSNPSETFTIGDFEYERTEPHATDSVDVVLAPCLPSVVIGTDGSSATYSTDSGQDGDRVAFETQQLLAPEGWYALSFDCDGDYPKVVFNDFHGVRSQLHDENESLFSSQGSGFYFFTYNFELYDDPQFFSRFVPAFHRGRIQFVFGPSRSGQISNVKIKEVFTDNHSGFHPQYRSPNLPSYHEDDSFDLIFHTGDVVDIPIARVGRPDVFGVDEGFGVFGALRNADGRLQGTITQLGNGLSRFGSRIKSVSQLQYPNAFLANPNTPAADGSVGNVLPIFTDNETVFAIQLQTGTLPPGFVVESDTGRIFHPGNDMTQSSVTESASFAITTVNGVFISPTYEFTQSRPLQPFFVFGSYSNDDQPRSSGVTWRFNRDFAVEPRTPQNIIRDYGQPLRWTVEAGQMPPGFTIDFDSGVVSGEFLPNQQPQTGSVTIRLRNYQGTPRDVVVNWEIV